MNEKVFIKQFKESAEGLGINIILADDEIFTLIKKLPFLNEEEKAKIDPNQSSKVFLLIQSMLFEINEKSIKEIIEMFKPYINKSNADKFIKIIEWKAAYDWCKQFK